MPVIRTTPTTLDPTLRQSLLTRLRNEIEGRPSSGGPVIFEIPDGAERIDVLVVWEDWTELRSEDRTSLILDAYGKQQRIAQALGVTYGEATQQQLLPYAAVSAFEQHPKFASLVCGNDQSKVKELLAAVRMVKQTNGGIILPDGKIELRFPTRAMADNTFEKLIASEEDRELQWRVVTEASA
jgi:hypothetical protein